MSISREQDHNSNGKTILLKQNIQKEKSRFAKLTWTTKDILQVKRVSLTWLDY